MCGMQNSLINKGVDNYVFIELKCLHTTHSRPLLLPDDKINPVKALQFAEMKEDIIWGHFLSQSTSVVITGIRRGSSDMA